MNSMMARALTALSLTVLVSGAALAGPPKKAPAKAVTCPACKMPLSAKKTKDDPTAVYVKGKTLYCCSKCKMDKSLTTKPGKGAKSEKPSKGGKM